MAFKRDLFTGELVEVESSGEGRQVIYREEIPASMTQEKTCNPWSRPWRCTSLGVANPDQIPEFNEAAKKFAGPGVYYDTQGRLVCESRGARNRALAMLGKVDYDGGYGDRTESRRAA